MLSYIKNIITAFDKEYQKKKITKSSASPNDIFVVNEDWKKLDQEKVVEFHNLVANIFYDNKRARPDTCTTSEAQESFHWLSVRIEAKF